MPHRSNTACPFQRARGLWTSARVQLFLEPWPPSPTCLLRASGQVKSRPMCLGTKRSGAPELILCTLFSFPPLPLSGMQSTSSPQGLSWEPHFEKLSWCFPRKQIKNWPFISILQGEGEGLPQRLLCKLPVAAALWKEPGRDSTVSS